MRSQGGKLQDGDVENPACSERAAAKLQSDRYSRELFICRLAPQETCLRSSLIEFQDTTTAAKLRRKADRTEWKEAGGLENTFSDFVSRLVFSGNRNVQTRSERDHLWLVSSDLEQPAALRSSQMNPKMESRDHSANILRKASCGCARQLAARSRTGCTAGDRTSSYKGFDMPNIMLRYL